MNATIPVSFGMLKCVKQGPHDITRGWLLHFLLRLYMFGAESLQLVGYIAWTRKNMSLFIISTNRNGYNKAPRRRSFGPLRLKLMGLVSFSRSVDQRFGISPNHSPPPPLLPCGCSIRHISFALYISVPF
jgi:hypothetical protein